MISLHKKNRVWFLEKGSVDLFKVEKRQGKLEGPRSFIVRVEGPGYLFFFDEADLPFEIVAIPSADALIREESYEGFNKKEEIVRWIQLLGGDTSLDLKSFQHLFLHQLFQKEELDKKQELKRYAQKDEEEALNLSQSLKKMITCLNPEELDFENGGKDLLFEACQRVSKYLKLSLRKPDDYPKEEDASLHIEAICQASGIRKRQVVLENGFWKKDTGPLVGFYKESFLPVALVPNRFGHYFLEHPKTGRKKRVDKKVYQSLHSEAFSLYRTFDDSLRTSKDVLKFYFKTNLKRYTPLIIYSSLVALISLFPPIATKIIFSTAIPDNSFPLLLQVSIGLLIAALSSGILFFFRSLVLVRIEGHGSHDIQSALWDRLLKLPVQFFRRFSAGNLLLRVNALEQIRSLLSDKTVRTIVMGIFSSFYLIAMGIFAPQLTLIALSVIFLSLLIALLCMRSATRIEKDVLELQGKINGLLIQIISGIAKLRVAGAENNAFAKWANHFASYKKLDLRRQNIQNIVSIVNSLMPLFSLALIFGYAMILREKNEISLSNLLAFNAAFLVFSAGIYNLSSTILELSPIKPLWNRVKVILDQEPETHLESNHPGALSGEIHIDELYFHYEKEGPLILNNISMEIKPKESIGIVGPSGCGKSTLVRMLLRFEIPDSGGIYYGEKDLSLLNIHELRKQVGVVLQNGGIISGSIYDNIVCGGIYTIEQIDRALELSGFQKDLEEMPMGFHTYLPMGGETLSGGQKQRLLIARALLPNPSILIFDEATSALDNATQEEISRNIDSLDVTRIIIAHRLSTIRDVDRIYLMEKGQIIDQGSYEELADRSELFSHMLHRQKL